MKTFVLILAFASSAFATSGESSSGTRGGGDPQAVEFLEAARDITLYLERSTVLDPLATADVRALAKTLAQRMENAETTSIRFTSQTLSDESGAEKFALFDRERLEITVNREAWLKNGRDFQLELVALELFGLAQIPDRYSRVSRLNLKLIDETARIRKSGWDFATIHEHQDVIALEDPYTSFTVESLGHLPFVSQSFTKRALDVICSMFGYRDALDGSMQALDPAFSGSANVFDDRGGVSTPVKLPGASSGYQQLKWIFCNR